MNICLVGYGAIAQKHMEALASNPAVNPCMLVGRRPEPCAAFAKQWNFKHHGLDLDAALADPDVDAVIITSPNELHVAHAEKSLQAGKHVLLEIPIALCFEDAQRVTRLSRQVNRRLMICHTMRYFPGIREVRRRVADGRLRLHQIIGFSVGEEDTLEFDNGTLFDAAGKVVVPNQSIVDLCEQNAEFVSAVCEGRDPAITGEEVLPAMRVLQMAQARAESVAS